MEFRYDLSKPHPYLDAEYDSEFVERIVMLLEHSISDRSRLKEPLEFAIDKLGPRIEFCPITAEQVSGFLD